MKIPSGTLRDWLVGPGYVSVADFDDCMLEASDKKVDVSQVLSDKNLVKDQNLGQLIADKIGVPFVDLQNESIDSKLTGLVSEKMASNKLFIIFSGSDGYYKVAFSDPFDIRLISVLEKKLGSIEAYFSTDQLIKQALGNYGFDTKKEVLRMIGELENLQIDPKRRDEAVVKLLDLLLQLGCQSNASDIHIEPRAKAISVRLRIDGTMAPAIEFPKAIYEHVLARIKILAKMRTDEHLAAQDGKFRFQPDASAIETSDSADIRVSVVPGIKGENVVMRILSSRSRQYTLDDLGFSESDMVKIKNGIKNPHGMILVTGPTGSGKTTTLYALVKLLNSSRINIASIEDPVEYEIDGITQIQVNPKANLTFASGLRAIVRQDPNIIMVGEIRDPETAGIAINSAMTGHLVLSTLHANDAVTTIPRFTEIGIEPFLVASSVRLIIAQRLVRRICGKCRTSTSPSQEEVRQIEQTPALSGYYAAKGYPDASKIIFYKGAGCQACNQTGYKDRIGIFEVLELSDEVGKGIIGRDSAEKIMETAKKNGMTTMLEDGLYKTLSGDTSLSEVLRVTKE